MSDEYYAFGEMLWDCLPSGRHAGGAPFNVASHLAQLGVPSGLISAVGQDTFGDEILEVAASKHVDTRFVSRVRVGLPTGTVIARVDEAGNATYELVQPVAWDEIRVPAAALAAVEASRAFLFGSLAGRSPYNLGQLDRLLALKGPTKFFDVNLRPPFSEPPQIVELALRADVLKLNHDEVGQMAMFLQTGTATPNSPATLDEVAAACAVLAQATATACLCVTMGAAGAALWTKGQITHATAPTVTVRDTVGAGDAFMAGLMIGLTYGAEPGAVLRTACQLGAYVASHHGATPLLPPEQAPAWITTLKTRHLAVDPSAAGSSPG